MARTRSVTCPAAKLDRSIEWRDPASAASRAFDRETGDPVPIGELKTRLDKPANACYRSEEIASFHRIRAGGRWEDEIDDAQIEADCVLVCWSNRATTPGARNADEKHVLQEEASYARKAKKLVACTLESVRERLFRERGLPSAIRSDNGVPFAAPNGLFNLSRLAVWWLRLGIEIERIKPGRPQQNGRHERMHRTLKKEATRPAGMNFLQQQARFDKFLEEFNTERPHEAIGMKRPADLYCRSPRAYSGLPEISYPMHDRDIIVTTCGRICMHRKKINIATVLAGQRLGIKEVDEGIWLVSFMHYDLGYVDLEQKTLQPLDNPFGPRLLGPVVI